MLEVEFALFKAKWKAEDFQLSRRLAAGAAAGKYLGT
jgi:hypothetical protein